MMTEKRSNKQILLDIEEKYSGVAVEIKEVRRTQEIMYTSLFGVPGTQNGGFIGSFNHARDSISENHERIEELGTAVAIIQDRGKPSKKKQTGFAGTIIAAIVGVLYGLGSRLGWW